MLKEQLRKARKAAGKTQKEVRQKMTEALNALDKGTYQATSKTTVSAWMNESTYCGYETGKRHPDAIKLNKISKFLAVSGDVLLETGIDQEASSADHRNDGESVCLTPEELHILQCFRSLNASGRSLAVSTMTNMSSNPSLREESSNI